MTLCRVSDVDLPTGVEQIDTLLIDSAGPDANANLGFVLTRTVRFIEQLRNEGRTVLLHCVACRSRTPTVAALYGARRQGISGEVALQEVAEVPPAASQMALLERPSSAWRRDLMLAGGRISRGISERQMGVVGSDRDADNITHTHPPPRFDSRDASSGAARADVHLVQIACDESGSEGENLVEGGSRVFTHGSTDLDTESAEQIIAAVREATQFNGAELKSATLLRTKSRRDVLLEMFEQGGPLSGHARVLLIDKWYMAAAKVIDLVIEEDAYAKGVDIYGTGDAYRMAQTLFQEGPRAFGEQRWQKLLRDFVSFVRRKQRVGSKTTEPELLMTIDELRLKCYRYRVSAIMEALWQARHYLADCSTPAIGTLEPLVPAIVSTARAWHQMRSAPIEVLHDRQAALTAETVNVILAVPAMRLPGSGIPPSIKNIRQVDSRIDARVQLADLVAGVGNWVASEALAGNLTDRDAKRVRPFLIADSMWGDPASWIQLNGAPVP